MPHYFTGTACVAAGTVRSSLTDWIVEAEVYVGGVEVDRFDYVRGEPATSDVALGVVFDSTHFPNGMNVQVEIYGWSNQGFVYDASGTAQVIDRIVGFNLPEFLMIPGGNGTWQLQQEMAGQNYGFHIVYHIGWNPLDVADGLQNAGVFYGNSHGSPNDFRTDEPDPSSPPLYREMLGQGPDTVEVIRYLREVWNGSDAPPYNSSGKPPVHFGQMDSCESGGHWTDPPPGNNSFSTLLVPYVDSNWPSAWTPNQAVWTWKGFTQAKCSLNQVWWVYSLMRDGYTAREARDIFVLHNSDPAFKHRKVSISPTGQWNTWVPVTIQDQVPVWGDPYARIKYVYTGNNLIPATAWYW